MTNSNPLPAELQALAREGWKIFPLGSAGESRKKPAIKLWPELASSDLSQLARWSQQFPGCNWGALTGEQFWVLDLDLSTGEAWLELQIRLHGVDWTNTLQVVTARGVHLYFSQPAGAVIRNSDSEIASGVDTRGWHGYSVIPPSVHPSGKLYSWRTDFKQPIFPAPGWLLALVQQHPALPKRGNGDSSQIPEGQRNSTLCSLAGTMRHKGMSEEAIAAALLAENAVNCTPPLPETEVADIAASVARYEPAPPEPRLILPQRGASAPHLQSELFETACEFSAKTPAETAWIVKPWIPAAGMVELVGKIKASGKTTFALAMAAAIVTSKPFLGQPCPKSPVVYLSEQPETSLREALKKAGLLECSDLHLLRWHRAMGIGWNEIAAAALKKAAETSARLLVVDTLGQFAQLLGDAENNSGQALEVLRPLQLAQEKGIAVLLVRHERKGDAEISDAGRGSSAFAGAVDVLLRLRRLGASHPATYRRLETLSRFEETPPDTILELTPEGYCTHDVQAVTLEAAEEKLLATLPKTEQEAKTCLELARATGQSRRSLERVLRELAATGIVRSVGAGIRGCAFRYWTDSGDAHG